MDSIREVMNWVRTLRIQGPNKSAAKSMERGLVKGRSHDAQLQILLQLPRELACFPLHFMICSLISPDPFPQTSVVYLLPKTMSFPSRPPQLLLSFPLGPENICPVEISMMKGMLYICIMRHGSHKAHGSSAGEPLRGD